MDESLRLVTTRTLLFITVILLLTNGSAEAKRKVLVISLDGFKWNYLNAFGSNLGNLSRIAKNVRAAYTIPVFPSQTFPNHYSIVTGEYPAQHGIISNTFLDPNLRAQFVKSKTDEKFWNQSEPIWITGTKQGVKSGIVYWPGSFTKFGNVTATHYIPNYSDDTPWNDRVDQIINWLVEDDVSLAMLYYPQPDKTSHLYGPESKQVYEKLLEIDDDIGYLLRRFDQLNLLGVVDIIVSSDHGMARVDTRRVVILSELLEGNHVDQFFDPELRTESWAHGSILHLWPRSEKILELFRLLNGKTKYIDFYLKDQIPSHWKFKDNDRIPPILGVAKLGWRAVWYRDDLNIPKVYGSLGTHGYDNRYTDMRGTFLAMGPSFKAHVVLEPFEILNIYALIAELSGIRPRQVAASLDPFKKALRHGSNQPSYASYNFDAKKTTKPSLGLDYRTPVQNKVVDLQSTACNYLPNFVLMVVALFFNKSLYCLIIYL